MRVLTQRYRASIKAALLVRGEAERAGVSAALRLPETSQTTSTGATLSSRLWPAFGGITWPRAALSC